MTAVWSEAMRVYAATRPAGGDWSPAVAISSAGTGSANDPAVAADAEGNLIAVWERYNGTRDIIESATKAPGAAGWSATTTLSATPMGSAENPVVAAAPGGAAVAAWSEFDTTSSTWQIRSRTGSTTTGLSSAARTLSSDTTGRAQGASADIAADGALIVAWAFQPSASTAPYKVNAVVRPAGGEWPVGSTTVESGPFVGRAAASIAGGTPRLVWQAQVSATDYSSKGRAARRDAGGSWVKQDLSAAYGSGVAFFSVEANQAGEAVAGWRACPSSGVCEVQTAVAAPGDDFAAPVRLGPASGVPDVAMSAAGAASASWPTYDATAGAQVWAAVRRDGAWAAPSRLSPAGRSAESPDLTSDADGNAVAVFTTDLAKTEGSLTTVYKTQVAPLDGAGPVLHSLAVPQTAEAGRPVTLSVAPSDPFSTVSAVGWGISDGGSATGTSATYTFAQPGTYTVVVKARDALGNESSASRTVVVTGGQAAVANGDTAATTPATTTPATTTPATITAIVPPAKVSAPASAPGSVVTPRAVSAALGAASAAATRALDRASVADVVKGKVAYPVAVPGAGRYVAELTAPVSRGRVVAAAKRKPVVLARATRVFAGAGTATVRLRVTRAGRKVLKAAAKRRGSVRITMSSGFTPVGGKALVRKRKVRVG